ncbi:hypothetical protein TNCV_1710181 [Trichonephila clavipes]|nr:hypothetical protein TNCV_1710181 [Trichonephila clavipes]
MNKRIPVLQHPPYSPDLTPYDFYMFLKLKNELMGTHFQSVGEMKRGPMPVNMSRLNVLSWCGVEIRSGVPELRCHSRRLTEVQNYEDRHQ